MILNRILPGDRALNATFNRIRSHSADSCAASWPSALTTSLSSCVKAFQFGFGLLGFLQKAVKRENKKQFDGNKLLIVVFTTSSGKT